jgi:enoyl-CoA hydratase/carnithine racemase
LRLGIVDRLAPSGVSAGEAAVEFARELADGPRDAFQAVVRCVDAARDQDFGSGMAIERDEVLRLFTSPDGREGVAAFLEKRSPSFGS